jgi:serine/threonine-protein kinase
MRVRLTVTEGPHQGHEFVFAQHDLFLVGRSRSAHLRLPDKDPYFSRLHCLVEVNPPSCRLTDLGSHNGTFVNGKKVVVKDLGDGDLIQAGTTVLQLSVEAPREMPATARHRTLRLSARPPSAARSSKVISRPKSLSADGHCLACGTALRALGQPGSLCPACRDQMERNPQPFPGYLVVKEMGQGSLGVVWLALRARDELPVALKLIAPAAGSPEDLDRFLREVRVLQHLDHPHIVSFLDVGETDGQIFLATDYVVGTDAAKTVEEQGPLPVNRAVALTCQLLEALEYAQEHGFVHRDIKPGNLIVSADPETRSTFSQPSAEFTPKRSAPGREVSRGARMPPESREYVHLTDFGLARVYQSSPLSGLTVVSDSGVPKNAGQAMARGHSDGRDYAFMAPERITAFRECKPPVDQYSAGAILYHLLTGRYVYDFPSRPTEQLMMVLLDDPAPILHRRPDLPPALAEIIHRSLARDPKNRFPDVWTMRAALAEFE